MIIVKERKGGGKRNWKVFSFKEKTRENFSIVVKFYSFFIADRWKHERKLLNPTFSLPILQSYVSIFNKCIVENVEILKQKCDKGEFDIKHNIEMLVMDSVLSKCWFSLRFILWNMNIETCDGDKNVNFSWFCFVWDFGDSSDYVKITQHQKVSRKFEMSCSSCCHHVNLNLFYFYLQIQFLVGTLQQVKRGRWRKMLKSKDMIHIKSTTGQHCECSIIFFWFFLDCWVLSGNEAWIHFYTTKLFTLSQSCKKMKNIVDNSFLISYQRNGSRNLISSALKIIHSCNHCRKYQKMVGIILKKK